MTRKANRKITDVDHFLYFAIAFLQAFSHFVGNQFAQRFFIGAQCFAYLPNNFAAFGSGPGAPFREGSLGFGHHFYAFGFGYGFVFYNCSVCFAIFLFCQGFCLDNLGFRYASSGGRVGSLLLGLYDEAGRLNHVGFTSAFAGIDRDELTARLEALRGGPGFTGRAPGGPSRWSTERSGEWEPLRPELVVEVGFDHVSDQRFRHGTKLLRFRPDKAPAQCLMEQLES